MLPRAGRTIAGIAVFAVSGCTLLGPEWGTLVVENNHATDDIVCIHVDDAVRFVGALHPGASKEMTVSRGCHQVKFDTMLGFAQGEACVGKRYIATVN